ncbi:MAG: hypothetical protein HQ514_18690 [Rhodospirillales bacterium]|nr:hypothetical protein [Rhodospirillales bacterium]
MVTIGGSDSLGISGQLLDFIGNKVCRKWPRLHIDFIIGPFAPQDSERNGLPENLICHVNPENFADLVRQADIAISAGGQTLFELARCGVATVGFALAHNQLANLQALDRMGAIRTIGMPDGDNWLEELETELGQLIDDAQMRENLSSTCSRIIDGLGATRIANAIKEFTCVD